MAAVSVSFLNRQKAVRIPTGTRPLVRKCCAAVWKAEGFRGPAEVSVSFVDNEQIRELNAEYRNRDAATDVLSFPLGENGAFDTDAETGAALLGDIVISVERALEQAEEYGHSVEREIGWLTVHSMLHLLGYDHETDEAAARGMREREEAVLSSLGLVREPAAQPEPDKPQCKNLFAAIIGRPNVGKSSLMNRILGEKIAIVSEKPQTTRNRITGILTKGETQYVFLDTPGVHVPRSKLGKFMVKQADASVADVDAILFVTEWRGPITAVEREIIAGFAKQPAPVILVINKIDLLEKKELLLEKIAQLSALFDFSAVVLLSALTGEGVDDLFAELEPFCSEGPHFFADDALTDQPERALIAEIIREKLLAHLRDEIPHGTAVVIEKMTEREDRNLVDIHATIVCERESHKGIIIGKRGALLKSVLTQARLDAEALLDCKVNLQGWVKVREGWRDSDVQLKNFGYAEE